MKHQHFAAVTDPKEIGALLRKLDGYNGTLVVRTALKLGIPCACRTYYG